MSKKILLAWFLLLGFCFSAIASAWAETRDHEYLPLEWSYSGNAVPETYWTPYLPLGAQEVTRLKIGFRFSTGTIGIKCPVKLSFTYDPATAKAGKDLAIKIKAETRPSNSYKTFESAFGLHLPNELQIGFIGITGVPDILPWFTLPWDLCGIMGMVPGLPKPVEDKVAIVCTAIANVGVNMETNDALPLSGSASYHDERTLFELELKEVISDQKKQDLALKFYNAISDSLGQYGMSELLLMLRLAKNLADEDAARDFLTGLCVKGVTKLVDFAKIKAIGDPYFDVEGVELRMNVRMYIPGGKGSGTYPLVFTANGQEQTVTFRDITPFIEANDKLTLVVDNMEYRFKLKQGLIPKIGLSLLPISIPKYEKYVTLGTAKRSFSETDYKLEVPLSASTDVIQSMRSNPGCQSVSINWASPAVPLKGTVEAYDGNTLVKTVTESTFRIAHNVIVPGLTMSKTYHFDVKCVNEGGMVFPGGSVTQTTLSECKERVSLATCNTLTISNVQAQAGRNYIDFVWDTNQLSSTEILLSPSPDLSVNYFCAIKKEGNAVVQGWGTRGGERQLDTSHSIRVSDLDPGTKYYYNVVSWSFEENNPTKNPINRVGAISDITTLPPPPPVTTIIDVRQGNTSKGNVPVEVWKQGGTGPVMTVTTANNGLSVPVPLDIGTTYIMKIRNQECYKDFDSSPITITGDPYQQDIDRVYLEAAYKNPAGAYVFDRWGQPISGATATMQLPTNQTITATTDATGYYVFRPYIPLSSTPIVITKQNYVTKQVTAKVEPCSTTRKMSIENAVLDSVFATLNVKAIDATNAAINNAAVAIKEGSTPIGNLTTNAQGKAILTYNFNDNNANAHTLTVTVTPPTATGIKPNSKEVSIIGGSSEDVEIMCLKPPPVAPPPAFTAADLNLRAESITGTSAVLKWNKYTQPATFGKYIVIKPANLTATTGQVVGTITDINTIQYPFSNLAVNTEYRYILSVYGPNNNILVGPAPVNFKTIATLPVISGFRVVPEEAVEAGKNVTVSAKISDPDSQIKKVILKLIKTDDKSQTVLVSKDYASNSVAFSHTFAPANAGSYIIVMEGKDEVNSVERDAKFTVTLPKIEEKTEEKPLEEKPKEEVLMEEKLSHQKPLQQKPAEQKPVEQQLQAQKPAEQKPAQELPVLEKSALKFISKPSSAYVNKEYAVKLGVRSLKGKPIESRFTLDWGDGKKDQAEAEVSLKHVYQKEGKYTLAATASLKAAGGFTAPEPVSAELTVKVKPPTMALSRSAAKTGAEGYNFVIKADDGSYPVEKWALSFGDGKSESGVGKTSSTTFNHVYAGPGTYKAELAVTDSSGAVTKKSLSFTIAPKKN